MTSLNQASMAEAAANAEESGPIDPFKTNPAKEEVLHALCDRTGYQLTQENGQRKYGGPPPGWIDPIPGKGCEIFVGKLPRDLFEDELVPVLETCGKIYELRLMMDFNGNNRGFAFVKYCVQADAKKALKELNNFEIRKGRLLGVCKSVDNCRLFVGGIPKNKQKTEILTEMKKLSEGVIDVIVYPSAGDKTKNRGFAFVEYQDHHTAAMARRKLMHNRPQLWGHQIAVDWAEPEVEVDDDIMAQVKILYVRNLMLNTTDDALEKVFQSVVGNQGAIERVKKIRDYAFIHFNTRENALKCMRALNGHILDGAPMQVTLAKPVDRETYVRYTRAANRQNVVEAEEQLTQAAFPYVAPTAIDPASLAAYQTAYQGTIYYNGIPYATTSAAIPGMPVTQRIPAGNLAYQGRQAVQIGSVPQIGAAGVPLGIPGASSGIPLAAAAARGITARGRVRGAGGTRPIQTTRGYLGRGYGMTYYRRPVWHPPPHQVVSESVEQGVKYDLMPEMELIPINPQSIKLTNQQKSSVQILEDLCKKNQWEMPDYKLHSAVGQNGLQLFLYRVSIPGLSNNPQPQQPDQLSRSPSSSPSQALQQLSSPKQFTPTKLSTSLDVAKEIAAEYVIQNISHDQISTDGDGGVSPVSSDISPTTVYLTNGIAVTNGNHGIRSYATEANVPPSFNNFVFQNGGYSENITATTVNGHMYHQY